MNKSKRTSVIEGILVVLLLVAGIALRFVCIGNVKPESVYFDLAKIVEGQSVPVVVHGAVYVYLQLLHLLFWVFGNIFEAAIWLQIVMQMVAIIFVYFGVRKLAGTLSAVVVLGFSMLSPLGINHALFLSAESLFFLVFSITFYTCIRCINGNKGMIGSIVTGLLVAFACYLDIVGLVLLVFVIIGSLQQKRSNGNVLVCVISVVAGFGLLIWVDSLMSSKTLGSVLGAWWNLYIPGMFDLSFGRTYGYFSVEWLVLLLLVVIGIFSCLFLRKRGNLGLWAFSAIVLLGLQAFGMVTDEVTGRMELYILLAALAGNSIRALFVREAVSVEKVWEDGKLEVQLEAISQETSGGELEEISIEPRVKFIENPLPLPKKHVKKVMDFDKELEAGQEKFDIEVAEDDDFDI